MGSTAPGLFDGVDSPTTLLNKSLPCNLGSWHREGSSSTCSPSALGFGLDRFRGPMKQRMRGKDKIYESCGL